MNLKSPFSAELIRVLFGPKTMAVSTKKNPSTLVYHSQLVRICLFVYHKLRISFTCRDKGAARVVFLDAGSAGDRVPDGWPQVESSKVAFQESENVAARQDHVLREVFSSLPSV